MSYFGVHNHTMYSNIRLLDSINRPKDLIETAFRLGLSGIAITDHECLAAHVQIEKIAKDFNKLHPDFTIALGNEIYLTETRESRQKYYHFILVAKDAVGHRMLRELSSTAWYHSYSDRGMERVPTLKSELKTIVERNPGHLIATTACIGGELSQLLLDLEKWKNVKQEERARETENQILDFLSFCLRLFGEDFYIEIAPSSYEDQLLVNRRLLDLACAYNIPVTVGTDAHYLTTEERAVHKAYLNSKGGEREVDSFYEFARLMPEEEVINLLSLCYSHEEIRRILQNSRRLQEKIQPFSLFHTQDIPAVLVADYPKASNIFAEDLRQQGFPHLASMSQSSERQNRYWFNQCADKLREIGQWNKAYLTELEEEARVKQIISEKLGTNMFRYPNTLQHYIDMIWECGSMVGAGRGSSCAALNHFLMGITQLNPIEWDLPFFRYLNEERVELGSLRLILPSCKKRM